eukprot:2027140-Rhodomonas_salina.3
MAHHNPRDADPNELCLRGLGPLSLPSLLLSSIHSLTRFQPNQLSVQSLTASAVRADVVRARRSEHRLHPPHARSLPPHLRPASPQGLTPSLPLSSSDASCPTRTRDVSRCVLAGLAVTSGSQVLALDLFALLYVPRFRPLPPMPRLRAINLCPPYALPSTDTSVRT